MIFGGRVHAEVVGVDVVARGDRDRCPPDGLAVLSNLLSYRHRVQSELMATRNDAGERDGSGRFIKIDDGPGGQFARTDGDIVVSVQSQSYVSEG
jgi:hypothetical protein